MCVRGRAMEGTTGAVEFLSVECDMIFEPDCDLESESQTDSQQEGGQEGEGAELPPCPTPTPNHTSLTPLLVNELFRRRNVGVYSRKDPNDHFVLIYDPTLHSPVRGDEAGWSSPEEEGAGQGEARRRAERCSVCHKQFRSHGCLVVHGLTHITPGTAPPCPVCAAVLPSHSALKIHVRRHFSMQTYQCPGCPQRHLSRAQLVMHQQLHSTHRHHPPTTPSPTINPTQRQAQERVQSPPELQPKVEPSSQEASPTPEPVLRCERCNVTCPTRKALWAHRKSHRDRRHRRRRRHECPECGSQFWRSSGLKKHRRNEHDV